MDKKLLDALNNLSLALEEIGEALASKKSAATPTADALKKGNFVDQIAQINTSVKEIKKDTKQILANQQTILALSKQKGNKDDLAEKVGGDKNKQKFIKDGLGVIMLMAVAIVALGLAFKLIGGVNFFSVIALSAAIVILSIAFVNVHTALKKSGFQPKDGFNFVIATGAMPLGIAVASWALQLVTPISLAKFFTTVFIAGALAVVAYGINGFLTAFKGKSIKDVTMASIALPVILPAIAMGIALSSWALQLVKPISLAQFFTTIFISGAFTVVAFGMNKLLKAFEGKSVKDIALAALGLPIILPAIAMGIAISSWALQTVTPISLAQFFTTIFIALTFSVIAFSMNRLIKAFEGKDVKDIVKVTAGLILVLPAIALAITISSWILTESKTIPLGKLFNILVLGAILAGITLAMLPAFKVLQNVGVGALLKGALGIIVVAGAIMVSSLILGLGDYDNYPSLKWAFGVGLAYLAFIPAVLVLGAIAMTGIGSLAILAGAGLAIVIAGTIVAVSQVLSKGEYGYGKQMAPWASSVALLYLTFTPIMMVLGAMGLVGAVISFFGGPDPFEVAKRMMIQIAQTIVDVSKVLATGNWKQGPTKSWAEGVSLAIGAFAPVYSSLFSQGIFQLLFGGKSKAESMADSIRTISYAIIQAGHIFNSAPDVWKGGPTKRWAEGVGQAIGAFAPTYKMLSDEAGWGFTGTTADKIAEFNSFMTSVAHGIIAVGEIFNKNKTEFTGAFPKKKWGEGVGAAIQAFAPTYQMLSDESGWFGTVTEEADKFNNVMIMISKGVIAVAKLFQGATDIKWDSLPAPSAKWGEGIGGAIMAFSPIYQYLSDEAGWFGSAEEEAAKMQGVILRMTGTIVAVSRVLRLGEFTKIIPPSWMKNVTTAIVQFTQLASFMKGKSGSGGFLNTISNLFGAKKEATLDPISQAAMGIVKLSKAYDKLADSFSKFNGVLTKMDADKLMAFKSLAGNLALLSLMDAELFDAMLDKLEEKAGSFSDIVSQFEKQQAESAPIVGKKPGGGTVTTGGKKSDSDILGEKLDRIAASLADIQTVVGSQGSLSTYMSSLGKEANIGNNNSAGGYR